VEAVIYTDGGMDASPTHLAGARVSAAIGALVSEDASRFTDPDAIV